MSSFQTVKEEAVTKVGIICHLQNVGAHTQKKMFCNFIQKGRVCEKISVNTIFYANGWG